MLRLTLSIVVATFVLVQLGHAQQRPMAKTDAQRVELLRLHEKLRASTEDHHDEYAEAMYIGNEQTIPLLLERLRQDYGATEPAPHAGAIPGFICTQVHLVDALRSITNTDQGMFYPNWARWWEANNASTRETWILDGFAQVGLHPVDPADDKFALELIELLGGKHFYLTINAQRFLARQRAELRAAWAASAARSEKPQQRRGVVKLLAETNTSGSEALLRGLATDPDEEIRKLAARTLAERQHDSKH
jgi:hypothetical protein